MYNTCNNFIPDLADAVPCSSSAALTLSSLSLDALVNEHKALASLSLEVIFENRTHAHDGTRMLAGAGSIHAYNSERTVANVDTRMVHRDWRSARENADLQMAHGDWCSERADFARRMTAGAATSEPSHGAQRLA